jgi:hypothetical protein
MSAYMTGNAQAMSYTVDTAYRGELNKSYTDRVTQSRGRQVPYEGGSQTMKVHNASIFDR